MQFGKKSLNDVEISIILECINSKIDYLDNCDLPDDYCDKKIKNLEKIWQKIYNLL